MINQQSTN